MTSALQIANLLTYSAVRGELTLFIITTLLAVLFHLTLLSICRLQYTSLFFSEADHKAVARGRVVPHTATGQLRTCCDRKQQFST